METFKKEFIEIITNIEFWSVKDTFQKKLKEDILKKQAANCRLCRQNSNIYEIPKQQHKKLLHDNAIKTYIKAPPKLETSINLEAKTIGELIYLDDRNTYFYYAQIP